MRALGCATIIVLVAIIAFLTRGEWLPMIPGRHGTAATTSTWQPLTVDGARRAQNALQRLRSPRGAAYVDVAPGDLAAYIFQELSHSLPASSDSVEAAAIGERLYVRAIVRTKDLGATNVLGPLAVLFGERERMQLGGSLHILRPGSAELQVKEMRIGNLAVPPSLIPRIIRQMSSSERPDGLAPDGLPLRTPEYIGDVRVSNGRITLYRTAPAR